MKQQFIAYLKDESGQTSTEYILLVAVGAAIVVKFKGVIMTKLGLDGDGSSGVMGEVFGKVSTEINSM
jgi:pilus assembly protein Flp/PilA